MDLTTQFPRSGRDLLGGYAWLARLADKARAEREGTQGDYIAYCPMSMNWLNTVGVSRDEFSELISKGASDQDLVRFFDQHVDGRRKEKANALVLQENAAHLDQQDAEEGR